jgi:hypothetical protein
MIPVIFVWDSIWNGVQMILGLVGSRTGTLGITKGTQRKALEAPIPAAAASANSQGCHSGR